MANTIDLIQRDKKLQEHWLRRVVAFIIDYIIIAIIVWVFSIFLFSFLFIFIPYFWWFTGWLIAGGILLLYAGIFEGIRGATFGKELLKMRVINRNGKMDIEKGLMRNISKIFWFFLLLDLIIALITDGEPKQRYLDRITNTTVEDIR